MKLFNLSLGGVALVVMMSGCQSSGPIQMAGIGGGSVVGNGEVSYQNSTLGVAFNYPSSWSLTESADHKNVALHSEQSGGLSGAPDSNDSQITFTLSDTFKGKKILTQQELLAALTASEPNQSWTSVQLDSGQAGYFWKTTNQGVASGEYEVLDQNYNVLSIAYSAVSFADGKDVILNIVHSLTVDTQPPVVDQMYFEPTTASPGDTVKLVVYAHDVVSEVDLTSMGNNPSYVLSSGTPPFTATMGYDVSHRRYTDGIWDDYPLVGGFKQAQDNRFEYSFTVPEGAPTGVISLVTLQVADTRGNILRLNADAQHAGDNDFHNFDDSYGMTSDAGAKPSALQQTLKRVDLQVTNNKTVFSSNPVLKNMYFQFTDILKSATVQSLYIQVDDQSPLRSESRIHFNVDCVQSEGGLQALGNGLYQLKLDVSQCFDPRYSPSYQPTETTFYPGTFIPRVIHVDGISLIDEVGNRTDGSGTNIIGKDIVFQLLQ